MIASLLALAAQAGGPAEAPVIALRAREVHTVSGETLRDAVVLVRGGKIAEVGTDVRVPRGARMFEGGAATPGLIDADSTAGIAGSGAEDSSEVTPALRVLDALDPKAREFERLARAGVTAVFLTPATSNVFGGLGAVVKTAGESVDARVVVAASALKAAMGEDPSRGNIPVRFGTPTNFRFRRPTTRMGVVWLFRKAFFDAAEYRKKRAAWRVVSASFPPDPSSQRESERPPRDEGLEILGEVLDGKRALRITARRAPDIRTAIRLAEEFNLKIQIDEATEGYRCAAELKERGIPVVAGPIEATPPPFTRRSEADEPCLGNAALLEKAGVLLALTANDRRGEEALPGQALFAVRYGLSFEAALRATTLNPARILGVEGRIGSIEKGKDADLVLWSGEPFATRPLLVLVDGRVAYDASADPALADGAPSTR